MNKQNKNIKSGFTLLELLIAVLIIGILAAVSVSQYNKIIYKSRFTQAKTLVKTIADAEKRFYDANKKYTIDLQALDVNIPPPNSTTVSGGALYVYYPWGEILLFNESYQSDVQVFIYKNNDWYISYVEMFSHSASWPGKRFCVSYGSSGVKPVEKDLNYKLCKEDTNDSNPGVWGARSLYWTYK